MKLKFEREALKANYSSLSQQYEGLREDYEELIGSYNLLSLEYAHLRENYREAIREIQALKSQLSSKTLYRNPTYEEVLKFIAEDKTNENEYIPEGYVCLNFAIDVNNHVKPLG